MKRTLVTFMTVLLLMSLACSQDRQDRITFAASSSSGTYKVMLGEIMSECSDDSLQITMAPEKGGATENLEALANNEVQAAFLHSDVLYAAAQSDPNYKTLKTLVALYPEEIHVLALRTSKTKKVGWSFGVQEFSNLADLKGFTVGAAGGGVTTSRILKVPGEFQVRAYNSGKEVLDGLNNGDIAAAIFVGGAPLPNLQGLSGDTYKLLSIPESISSQLTGVYRSATINYQNLRSGSIKTLAPSAIIATRKYNKPAFIAPQVKFRNCFYQHLDDLKETPGKHRKWQQVSATDQGVWDWLDLPTAKVVVVKSKK